MTRTELIGHTPSPRRPLFLASALVTVAASLATVILLDKSSGFAAAPQAGGPGNRVIAWNNLGMHCTDSDFAVFSLLPPFNTVDAQVIRGSKLVNTGVSLTYEAVADPSGSVNTTAQGKTNFWDHVMEQYGVALPVDAGLAGSNMPGPANTPQPMPFSTSMALFEAAGIPIYPIDDAGKKNPYPLMRVIAKDVNSNIIATTDVVLPVSDEMGCSSCHASGKNATKPAAGWVFDPNADRDFRLNILRLHDGKHAGTALYTAALAAKGYNASGLYAGVVNEHKSVLCATCHLSEALPGTGFAGVKDLTKAIHGVHKNAADPVTGLPLDSIDNRSSCYRCHPGSETKCLRGAMGASVAPDGSMAMQCQSCHGNLTKVADPNRTGWLDEPKCQSCHTGTALQNNGQIRFTSVYDTNGKEIQAVNQTFATNPNTPGPGLSLYRFSKGHGGLACSACHGSTHAEFPSSHVNDNLQNLQIQGHAGTLVECSACHASVPNTATGGPHGMHPVGQVFIDKHPDIVEAGGSAACRACHGLDYKGTVLSRSQANRSLSTKYGTKNFWDGFQIGCYNCHNGPNSNDAINNSPAVAQNKTLVTNVDLTGSVTLTATDANGNSLTYRIVSQPDHGTVALAGTQATFFPDKGYGGADFFTYAAWDGFTDSNLAIVSVNVNDPGTLLGIVKYGSGTPGCSGIHDLGANSTPNVKSPNFTLIATNAPPVSLGLGLVSDAQDLTGSDSLYLGVIFHVDFFAAQELLAFDFVSTSTGHATALTPIPNLAVLVGKTYYAQGVFIWTWPCSPSPFGFSTSRGLAITVQP